MTINKAEKVFMNGFVYTSGYNSRLAEAIAIRDGKFIFIGNQDEIQSWIDKDTEVIDLNGKMILPSFFEAHCHAQSMAQLMFSVDITEAETFKEYISSVNTFATEHSDYQCITGFGWTNTTFPPCGPQKEDLDEICKDIPVALWSVDHHSLWVNSKALQLAGITKDTPDPRGGRIEKNEFGEPSGTLREGAADLVMKAIPDFTVEQYKASILEYQRMANGLGFTGSFDAVLNVESNALTAYKELASNGDLTMYFKGAYCYDMEKGFEQIKAFCNARENDNVSELFQINTVKIFEDGVIEGATAYLTEPYAEGANLPEGSRGEPIWKKELLKQAFTEIEKNGFQIHVHSIGDAATKETLDAFDFAKNQNDKRDQRHAITHLQIVDASDIPRFKKLGIVAVVNPYWFTKDDYFYNIQIPYLGKERAEKEYPLNSFFKEGVTVASASDFPITCNPNPFVGIEIGVTRLTLEFLLPMICSDPDDPKFRETLWPDEKASRQDMVDSFTYNAAFAHFLEDETGSIEVGKSADMIVLDKNIFDIQETEISGAKVLLTLFKGEEVYKDDAFTTACSAE
jgi:Predicted metal-dependent hydrolase with the TIM-barrel fold